MSTEKIHIEEEETVEEGNGRSWTEEFSVAGADILEALKQIAKDTTARKIIVQNDQGKKLLEIPLIAGIAGMLMVGPWSAAGLVFAWIANYSIIVEHTVVEFENETETEVVEKAEPASENKAEERCQATTKAGAQCKRQATAGSDFCSTHQ